MMVNLTQENAFFVVIFTHNIINLDKKRGILAKTLKKYAQKKSHD